MTKQLSDEQLEACVSSIEKQLAKPLRALGKIHLPKKGTSLNRTITVESRAGSTLHVTVDHEHSGGFSNKPTGLYAVHVQGVRSSDSRVKHRPRDFTGLSAQLTDEQVETIITCVQKHLATKDQVTLELDARFTERDHAEKQAKQQMAEQHARLRKIGKAHGLESSYGMILEDNLNVTCQGADFCVTLNRLSKAELEQFLAFWTKRPKS